MIVAAVLLAATLDTLDSRIEQGMRDTGTRSLAVAVVHDDRVVYRRTFNATPETRFYLASAPKPMTALTARLLAHDKKLDLDAPLTATLPQLKLPPPLDPARMSVRDLLTHRLGFENDPVTWRASYSGDLSDEKVFALLARYTTVTPRQFRYDNLGYMLASYAVERAAGESWWIALTKRVLAPAGMTRTSNEPCTTTKSLRTMNRGSGGLCSTLDDMSRWLRVNMSDGVLDGKRVFPLAVMREVHSPQVSLSRRFGRLDRYAYGLGWYVGSYEDDVVIHHFGSYPEAWAHVSWMPDRNVGVVVLANEMNPFPDAVAMLAYDTFLGRADADVRFRKDVEEIREILASIPKQIEGWTDEVAAESADSDRPLESFAGIYKNDALGTLVVTREGDTLRATIGDRTSALKRVRGEVFSAQWFPRSEPLRLTFGKDTLKWGERTFTRQ